MHIAYYIPCPGSKQPMGAGLVVLWWHHTNSCSLEYWVGSHLQTHNSNSKCSLWTGTFKAGANRTHHSVSTQSLSTIQKDLPQAAQESGVRCNSMRTHCCTAKMQGCKSSLSSWMSGKQYSKTDVFKWLKCFLSFLSCLWEERIMLGKPKGLLS